MAYTRIAAIGECTTSLTMTNKTILMTVDNIVCICGDIQGTVAANGVLFTLPDSSMYPEQDILLIVMGLSGGTYSQRRIRVKPNGDVVSDSAATNMTFFTNGFMFHVNSKFYNSTLGNNDESIMTSPLYYE